MKDFQGRVAAITGAGSGIGRALAINLAAAGCHLSLSDVNESGLADTVAQLQQSGVKVTSARVDVAQRAEVEAWAEQTAKDHGKVNLIFNNAGVALGGTVEGTSIEEYEWIVNINLWGVIYGTKAFLPHLVASGEGHVINV
ncbi:MAG: SDR family oxidoreductase, partial [Oceanococcaceae bacterium]